MIKTIIFDLDNTLYDYDLCHNHGLKLAYEKWREIGYNESLEEFKELYSTSRIWVKKFLSDTAASHSRALYFQKLVETVEGIPNTKIIIKLYDSYYEGFYRNLQAFPKIDEVLQKLKQANYQLAIVSNMLAETQYRKLALLNLGDMFDFIITSQSVEHEKPHPHIYSHTLTLTGSSPEETVMIGDSIVDDIEPALWMGMKAIWFNPKGFEPSVTIEKEYSTIKNYDNLLTEIAKLNS
ncbi:MAG: HAD family hydrolase [Candidatus Hodarchaeales archaeon]|jgi:putative hydrolase of the HAD superfamily